MISHVTFTAFDFSIVSHMKLLFQLQGQYCFSLTTKQWIILHSYGTKLQERSTLTVLQVTSHSEIDTSPLAGWWRVEEISANMSCPKTFFFLLCESPSTENWQTAAATFMRLLLCKWGYRLFLCVSDRQSTSGTNRDADRWEQEDSHVVLPGDAVYLRSLWISDMEKMGKRASCLWEVTVDQRV